MNKQLDDFLRNDASEMQKTRIGERSNERTKNESHTNLTTISELAPPTEKRRRLMQ